MRRSQRGLRGPDHLRQPELGPGRILGTTPDYLDVRNWPTGSRASRSPTATFAAGRGLPDRPDHRPPSCSATESPLGKEIRIPISSMQGGRRAQPQGREHDGQGSGRFPARALDHDQVPRHRHPGRRSQSGLPAVGCSRRSTRSSQLYPSQQPAALSASSPPVQAADTPQLIALRRPRRHLGLAPATPRHSRWRFARSPLCCATAIDSGPERRTISEFATMTEISKALASDQPGHDQSAAGRGAHFAGRRRRRHHEHHAGLGHRADPRDRPAHGGGRPRARHPAAIPGRGGRALPRWAASSASSLGRGVSVAGHASSCTGRRCPRCRPSSPPSRVSATVGIIFGYLSRLESLAARPHRGAAIRVGGERSQESGDRGQGTGDPQNRSGKAVPPPGNAVRRLGNVVPRLGIVVRRLEPSSPGWETPSPGWETPSDGWETLSDGGNRRPTAGNRRPPAGKRRLQVPKSPFLSEILRLEPENPPQPPDRMVFAPKNPLLGPPEPFCPSLPQCLRGSVVNSQRRPPESLG